MSIFISRQKSVYAIDSTFENTMTIKTSILSQVGKNIRTYFQRVLHCLVLGKRHQRHQHSSKLNSLY